MNKYVYRFACSVLLIGLAVSSFAFVWFRFIRVNNQTGHLMGAGNITMALILYSAIFFINGQWLRAFKLGVERKAKVVAGVVITVLVTDFLEIPISMAITGQFRFFTAFLVRYSILALVQSGVLIVLTICMVNIYRMIISPLTILEIVGDYKNDLAKELNGLANKYSIEETVYYSDEDIEKKMERSTHTGQPAELSRCSEMRNTAGMYWQEKPIRQIIKTISQRKTTERKTSISSLTIMRPLSAAPCGMPHSGS